MNNEFCDTRKKSFVSDEYPWLMGLLLGLYVFVLLPIWISIVRKNEFTKEVLKQGWTPVISALFISGWVTKNSLYLLMKLTNIKIIFPIFRSGGLVLDLAVGQFHGYEVFQPIINGIGGNLVSVQASRISTMFHKTSIRGFIPTHTKQWVSPFKALISGGMEYLFNYTFVI